MSVSANAQTQTSASEPAAQVDPSAYVVTAVPTSDKLSVADQKEMQSEIDLGKATADEIAKSETFVTDPIEIERVKTIGARLGAVADTTKVEWAGVFGNPSVYPFHYTYHVIKSKEVNAFSLPGGYIYIYQGLYDLLTTDDELAAVLGHETAHAAHHHVPTLMREAAKMQGQLALGTLLAVLAHVPIADVSNVAMGANLAQQSILNNKFSERAEEDADHTGAIFALKAGYNPVGMYSMLMRLKEDEDRSPDVELGFLRDHPLTSERLAAARAELAALGTPVTPGSLRETDGTMIAAVSDQSSGGEQGTDIAYASESITLGTTEIARVVPAERDSATEAAKLLNHLLDNNLQLYEVKSSGPTLIARDIPVFTFSDADADLLNSSTKLNPPPDVTASALASSAADAIRKLLWKDQVTGTSEGDIDVGASVSAIP